MEPLPLPLAEGIHGYLWFQSAFQRACAFQTPSLSQVPCYTFPSPLQHPNPSHPLLFTLNSLQLTAFPHHSYLSFLQASYSHYSLLPFSLCFLWSLSPAVLPLLTDNPGHVQATGQVQSTFFLCSDSYKCPVVLSHSYSKCLNTPRSSHAHSFLIVPSLFTSGAETLAYSVWILEMEKCKAVCV